MIFKTKHFFMALGLLTLISCSEINLGTIQDIVTIPEGESLSLSNDEVIAGLKQALNKGAEKAVGLASIEDGFYKNDLLYIPFPEDVVKVKEKVIEFGFSGQVEKFEMTLNRAAEEATKTAVPIFIDAIKNMSIQDGFNILKGENDAATSYLKNATRSSLINEFSPVVADAIDKVQLTKYWDPIVTKYNAINFLTGGEEINPDLNQYITDRAIDGLFIHIEKEEQNIRANPQARVTDLLQKVFGSID